VRVTELMMGSMLTANLQNDLTALSGVQQQLASGDRINQPSDNPIGAERLLQLQSARAQNSQYASDAQAASSWLDAYQAALGQAVQAADQARTLALQAANATNGTNGGAAMSAIHAQLQQLLASLVDIGNTQYAGQYLFNGQETATAPFVLSAGGTGVTTQYGATASQPLQRQVGPGVSVTLNPGTEAPARNVFQQATAVPAPVLSQAAGSSSLAAQAYNVGYALVDASGSPLAVSPVSAVTLTQAGNTISFDVPLPLASGAVALNVYVGGASGAPTLLGTVSLSGGVPTVTYAGGVSSGIVAAVQGSGSSQQLAITVSTVGAPSAAQTPGVGILAAVQQLLADTGTGPGANPAQLDNADLTNLDLALQSLQDAQGESGAVMQRVQFAQSQLSAQGVMLQQLSGSLDGADVAKLAVQLQELDNAYQGALAVGAHMILPTLANYLP
jgi:flagellar hook-associated protein 3